MEIINNIELLHDLNTIHIMFKVKEGEHWCKGKAQVVYFLNEILLN